MRGAILSDERCYFGCEAGVLHTLLYIPPPFSRTPRLCAAHSKGWRAYKSALGRDTRWPEDFWPWADKELEAMKRVDEAAVRKCYFGHEGPVVLGAVAQLGDDDVALCGPCAESWALFAKGCEAALWRTPEGYNSAFAEWAREVRAAVSAPPSVPAREATLGQWYFVPSGEIEQAVASWNGPSGFQAGFLPADWSHNDSDDIRWLPGDTEVILASEADVNAWYRAADESRLQAVTAPDAGQGDDPGPAQGARHGVPALTVASVVEPDGIASDDPRSRNNPPSNKLAPLFSSESGEWQTDADTFAWLNEWAKARWGSGFVLDVCASKENALCDAYFTKERSCLNEPSWPAPWFMNSPYGDPEHPCKVPYERCKKKGCQTRGFHVDVYVPGIIDFMGMAREQARQGRPGICLVPFRPGTEWWTRAVLAADGEQAAVGGDWAQGWAWVRWSSGLIVETRLISGRLSFKRPTRDETWTAPFPSVVVVFDRWK